MGLMQNALLTYQNNLDKVGKYYEGKEPLAPIGHIVTKANIIATIDQDGNYVRSEKAPDEKIIIPVTEKSAGRSSGLAPHPLCDQIKYLASYDKKSEKAWKEYLTNLKKWCESPYTDEKINAVYKYVTKNQICYDLSRDGNLEITETGKPSTDKWLIIWQVLGDWKETRTWCDVDLMTKYSQFYLNEIEQSSEREKDICAISGEYATVAQQHMKGAFSFAGNAKLISSNDNRNFTYRGRFDSPEEALTVSYKASQEAHNALKWLISNQGVVIGKRAYLCWSPQNDKIPEPGLSLLEQFFSEGIPEVRTEKDYHGALLKALGGYYSSLYDENQSETVMACFDAATSGRLAITFYSEMMTKDFLLRLKDWDSYCNWYHAKGVISSPALRRIVDFAYGIERDRTGIGRLDTDDQIRKQALERLIRCRISREVFPSDIERRIVENASNLSGYGSASRKNLLFVACAVIRKYHYDHYKEDLKMELESNKQDRSYQFGRLLAVYEKIEHDALQDIGDSRETNAMRWQSVYCNRPMHYAFELEKQMERAYFPRLWEGSKIYYKNLIGQIMEEINTFPEKEWDRPLKDTYLMGYYLQRREFYKKKDTE